MMVIGRGSIGGWIEGIGVVAKDVCLFYMGNVTLIIHAWSLRSLG